MFCIVITIFPEIFISFKKNIIVKNAIDTNHFSLKILDIRNFGINFNCQVYNKPYVFQEGVVLSLEPLLDIMDVVYQFSGYHYKIIYLSPQGKKITQQNINLLLNFTSIIFISSKFRGIDNRFFNFFDVEEWSVGDFILSSGDFAIMVFLDSLIRLLPSSLNNIFSIYEDSFFNNFLDIDLYTKPKKFLYNNVPSLLLCCNNNIKIYNLRNKLINTYNKRWDLLIFEN